ncbi:MAG: HNH endonuclease signature motif containing protein [Micromonosporaceae bacterium]
MSTNASTWRTCAPACHTRAPTTPCQQPKSAEAIANAWWESFRLFFGQPPQPAGTKHSYRDDVQDAEDKLNDARKRQEALKRKLINAGKLFLDIILEVTGAKAGIDCFLKGDVGGCIETAVSVISGLVGGLLVKIGLKYALKWKAAAKLAMKVKKLVTDIADVVKNWSKAADDVADAEKVADAARDGVALSLRYKKSWSNAQRAAARDKVDALNDAAVAGRLRVTAPGRSGTSAANRYRRAGNEVPDGTDVDHTVDLQLGGADDIDNMRPLDASVSRSLGAQIGAQLREVPATRYYMPGTNGSVGFRVLPGGVSGQSGIKGSAYLRYFGGPLAGIRVPLGVP